MGPYYHLSLSSWNQFLSQSLEKHPVYAPILRDVTIDYARIRKGMEEQILYNRPKPITPLKVFFNPVKENVARDVSMKPFWVLGVPACDLAALDILDEMYLKGPFEDPYYRMRREQALLIGMDCFSTEEHCHCTSYGETPFPDRNFDLALSRLSDEVILRVGSPKGERLIQEIEKTVPIGDGASKYLREINQLRKHVTEELHQRNLGLPDYQETGRLIEASADSIWEKYSRTCVSCGACATICPTCTCFLLIDRPRLEKVKVMDACQYPGFERVAGGEDPLKSRAMRFKNRYSCKYVWKPQKFQALACTGCGRCIETCIGRISKNELFKELAAHEN